MNAQLAEALDGIELGADDRRILQWLSGWEPSTVATIASLIVRARAAGQKVLDAQPAPAKPYDVIADLQRQQHIVDVARQTAEMHGNGAPGSGTEHYGQWRRRVLREAGETYRIVRGEQVTL